MAGGSLVRGRRVVAAAGSVALIALATMGAAAADAAGLRQNASFRFTATTPGSLTGVKVALEFQNPDNPNLKPYSVAKLIFHWPGPELGDTTVPARCEASDAQVMLQGPDACPPDSKVGSGEAVTDNGSGGGPFPRYGHQTVTAFNEASGILGLTVDDDVPAIKTVSHTKFENGAKTTELPTFPGLPPPEPYTPLKSMNLYFPPYERDGRPYGVTPSTCPAAGYWTFVADFIYHDGVTQSVVSRSPCDRGQRRSARQRRSVRHHRSVRHRRSAATRR
jgi:hypothetical protein